MPRSAPEIHQPPLGQDQNAVPVRENPLVILRPDRHALDACKLLEAGHIDLVVEVADVADDGLALHARHVTRGDDVLVAGGGDEDIGAIDHGVECPHFEPFHGRLQRADGINLSDDDARSLPAQRLRATLAHFAVAADDRQLAGDHDVRGTIESVDDGMAASVNVVEFCLRHRVVDVDGREEQLTRFHHLIQPVHSGRRLLGDPFDIGGNTRPPLRVALQFRTEKIEDDPPLFRLGALIEIRNLSLRFEFDAFVDKERGVATIINDEVRPSPIRPQQRLGGTPPVLLQRFALPGKHRDAARVVHGPARLRTSDNDRRRGMILCRKDVAAHPANVRAEKRQGLNQNASLHRHVQRPHNPCASERPGLPIPVTHSHQPRHFMLRQPDLRSSKRGQSEVANPERLPPGGTGGFK